MNEKQYLVEVNGGEYYLNGFTSEKEAKQFVLENDILEYWTPKQINECMKEYELASQLDVVGYFDGEMRVIEAINKTKYLN